MDSKQELEEQVRSLSQTVDEMRGRIARLEGEGPADGEKQARRSRRGFLRLGAGAAVGALGLAAGKILPAAAADGAAVVTGASVTGEHPTVITGDAATAVPVLQIKDPGFVLADLTGTGETFAGTLQGLGGHGGIDPLTATAVDGVDGFAEGVQAFGVYGLTDAGVGVVGESSTGIGLYARSSGRILQDPLAAAGVPGYAPNMMEQVRDLNGVLWIHNASGAWRRVNTLRTDKSDGSGTAFKPIRIVDTRNGKGGVTGPVANAQVKTFDVIGLSAGTIPTDAIAVVGNITAVGWNFSGFLTIFPAGVSYNPNTDPSSMNFSGTAYAWANSFTVGLGTGVNAGKVSVYIGVFSSGSTNFIIDITAYVQ